MSDDITGPLDRLAKARATDAKLREKIQSLANAMDSWPLAEQRAFLAEWIDRLENDGSPVAKMMARELTKGWMGR